MRILAHLLIFKVNISRKFLMLSSSYNLLNLTELIFGPNSILEQTNGKLKHNEESFDVTCSSGIHVVNRDKQGCHPITTAMQTIHSNKIKMKKKHSVHLDMNFSLHKNFN